jgi:hypothetical protein
MMLTCKSVIILIITSLFAKSAFNQVKDGDLSVIHFLNGDTLQISIVDQNKWITTALKKKKNDFKYSYKPYNNDQILSIINSEGEKDFMYKYDLSIGNLMEQKEMEQYVKGRTKAKYYYTAKTPFLLSFLLGVTIGLIDTYNFSDPSQDKGFLNGGVGLISLTTPFISSSIFGNNRVAFIDRKNQTDQDSLNESFTHGYAKEKKSKISKATFKGSLLGVVSIIFISFNKH